MDYCSTQRCDTFKAVDVEGCWVTEELHKWKDGVYEEGKEVN